MVITVRNCHVIRRFLVVASKESRIKKYINKKNSEESKVGNRWLELVGLTPFLTT